MAKSSKKPGVTIVIAVGGKPPSGPGKRGSMVPPAPSGGFKPSGKSSVPMMASPPPPVLMKKKGKR